MTDRAFVLPGYAALLAGIRARFAVPEAFPPAVVEAAAAAAARRPDAHRDRTDVAFVTLDPAGSVDLDQAFAIEARGSTLLLHYAIADVGWFVTPGDLIDKEAWTRGNTLYLPDGKAPLYPPLLSERAASLLPDGPRPAVIFTIAVDSGGEVRLVGVERAIIRSRAKLAYEAARDDQLPPHFAALTDRLADAERARGAARVDPPEQEVTRDPAGTWHLGFRHRHTSEERNALLSLACNMAVAQFLQAHRTGLFRELDPPTPAMLAKLRDLARALGLYWPDHQPLAVFEATLDPANARGGAFLRAVRRGGTGARYAPFRADHAPWHAAVAASYAHATAPLRRLADRYVVEAALALSNGAPLPAGSGEAFEALPAVMARADALSSRIERTVIDTAEAALLQGREGEAFAALIADLDEDGARIQLVDYPVVARLGRVNTLPGDGLFVTLAEADPANARLRFAAPPAP